jgi:flagellar basal-body rod protein FlgF
MDAAIYKALSGSVVQTHRLEVTSQDLANANTGGYKGQRLAFSEVLANRLPADDRPGGWVAISAQRTNFSPGVLEGTGNPFHLAVEGDGYFVVQTANGERYTRNGSFTMKGDGTVITPEGDTILGEDGPLRLRGQNFEVGIDGRVRSNNNEIGKLRIVRFIDNAKVMKVGINRFRSDADNVTAVADARMFQGYLEQSNVSPVDSMMVMISIHRQFESYQRAIKLMDGMTEKMINDSAR